MAKKDEGHTETQEGQGAGPLEPHSFPPAPRVAPRSSPGSRRGPPACVR